MRRELAAVVVDKDLTEDRWWASGHATANQAVAHASLMRAPMRCGTLRRMQQRLLPASAKDIRARLGQGQACDVLESQTC